jgi:hypothetical protein
MLTSVNGGKRDSRAGGRTIDLGEIVDGGERAG